MYKIHFKFNLGDERAKTAWAFVYESEIREMAKHPSLFVKDFSYSVYPKTYSYLEEPDPSTFKTNFVFMGYNYKFLTEFRSFLEGRYLTLGATVHLSLIDKVPKKFNLIEPDPSLCDNN